MINLFPFAFARHQAPVQTARESELSTSLFMDSFEKERDKDTGVTSEKKDGDGAPLVQSAQPVVAHTVPAMDTHISAAVIVKIPSQGGGRALPLIDLVLHRLEQNPHKISLAVEDKQLGLIGIQAFMRDGKVQLAIELTSTEARQSLERELAQMHSQLDARGVSLGRTAFSLRTKKKEKRS